MYVHAERRLGAVSAGAELSNRPWAGAPCGRSAAPPIGAPNVGPGVSATTTDAGYPQPPRPRSPEVHRYLSPGSCSMLKRGSRGARSGRPEPRRRVLGASVVPYTVSEGWAWRCHRTTTVTRCTWLLAIAWRFQDCSTGLRV